MHILLSGYYGFDNAGDELILESLITNIRKKDPQLTVTVLSKKPVFTSLIYGVYSVDRWSFVQIIKSISNCDIIIFSGGLYQDKTGSLSLYYYLAQIWLARLLNKKIYLCAIDFNRLKNRFNERLLKLTLAVVSKITVRNKGSYDLAVNELGIKPGADIEVTADIVFSNGSGSGLPVKKTEPAMFSVGLILRNKDVVKTKRFCEQLAGSFRNDNKQLELVFVPFHLDIDLKLSLDVVDGLSCGRSIIKMWNKPGDLFQIMSSIDFVVSERLHGLIISSLLNKPMVSVSKDTKLNFFMNEINGVWFPDFDPAREICAVITGNTGVNYDMSKISLLKDKSQHNIARFFS
jgi:polysaccharide pyruvyl transferase CsaB